MRELVQACSIVVIGGWNTKILTPPWLGNYIFNKDQLDMYFPMTPGHPIKITDNNTFSLDVSDSKIKLNPIEINDTSLEQLSFSMRQILSQLPHTPVDAIGINFGFEIEKDEYKSDIFDSIKDFSKKCVKDVDREIEVVAQIVNNLNDQYQNRILTITISHNYDTKDRIDFNFHKNTRGTEEAKMLLESSHFTALHNYATENMDSILILRGK